MRFTMAILCVTAGFAWSQASTKLGDTYTKADPAEKVAQLAVAQADKVIDYKETNEAMYEIATAYIQPGDTAEKRLRLLGELRKNAHALIEARNKVRKDEKKPWASALEPDTYLQQGLAMAYVAEAAGALPTVQSLGCLSVVRECTSWSSTSAQVAAHAQEALMRDETYMKGDLEKKLGIIKNMSEERQMLSDHERTLLEKTALSEWMAGKLKGGAKAAAVKAEIKTLYNKKLICFFTSSWADSMLGALEKIGQ